MANYRSAMGKTVDMASLMAQNETTRAVGNMKVNARGDTIDELGRVIQPITEKVNQAYSNTVSSTPANQVRQRPAHSAKPEPIKPDVKKVEAVVAPVELTQEELDLDRELEDDEIIEQMKAMEAKLPKAKK